MRTMRLRKLLLLLLERRRRRFFLRVMRRNMRRRIWDVVSVSGFVGCWSGLEGGFVEFEMFWGELGTLDGWIDG